MARREGGMSHPLEPRRLYRKKYKLELDKASYKEYNIDKRLKGDRNNDYSKKQISDVGI